MRPGTKLATVLTALGLLHSASSGALEPALNYMLNCMGCHTADGHGSPGKVPSLRDTLGPLAADPEGRRYLVEVPGVAQSQLSDAALAELLNWMLRNLPMEPARFAQFDASEVAHYRAQRLTRVAATRAQLLARIRAANLHPAARDAGN
jgi:cytochrome c553